MTIDFSVNNYSFSILELLKFQFTWVPLSKSMFFLLWLFWSLKLFSLSSQTVRPRNESEDYDVTVMGSNGYALKKAKTEDSLSSLSTPSSSVLESAFPAIRNDPSLTVSAPSFANPNINMASSQTIPQRTSVQESPPILQVPSDIFGLLLSFIPQEYTKLSLVCKHFHRLLSEHLNLCGIPRLIIPSFAAETSKTVSKKLALKALCVGSHLLINRPECLTSINTHLGPELEFVKEKAIRSLQEQLRHNRYGERISFQSAFKTALKSKDIKLIARLIEIVPQRKRGYLRVADEYYEGVIYPLYLESPSLVEMLNMAVPASVICPLLIFHPASAEVILNLKQSRASEPLRSVPGRLYYILAHVLAGQKTRTEDAALAAKLFVRNEEILEKVAATSVAALRHREVFRFLNNYLYGSDFSTQHILDSYNQMTLECRKSHAMELLFLSAINTDNMHLFNIVKAGKSLEVSDLLRKALNANPAFASKLGYTCYRAILGNRDPIPLAEFRQKHGMKPLTQLKTRQSKLGKALLAAKYGGDLEEYLKILGELPSWELTRLFTRLIEDLDDPAYIFVKTYNFVDADSLPGNLAIDAIKLFKSLLKTETINLDTDLMFTMHISHDLACALIDDNEIVQLRDTIRYKILLRHLSLSSFYDIDLHAWTIERVVALLKALHFPISFRVSSTFPDGPDDLELIRDPTRFQLGDPELANIDALPYLTIHVTNYADCIDDSIFYINGKSTLQSGRAVRDPLLLHSFPLWNLWRLTDWESFFIHSPVVDIFYPKPNIDMITEYYRKYPTRPELFERAIVVYKLFSLQIRIRSFTDFYTMVVCILPRIPQDYWPQIYFHFESGFKRHLLIPTMGESGPFTMNAEEVFGIYTTFFLQFLEKFHQEHTEINH